jgi:hypothetical protein
VQLIPLHVLRGLVLLTLPFSLCVRFKVSEYIVYTNIVQLIPLHVLLGPGLTLAHDGFLFLSSHLCSRKVISQQILLESEWDVMWLV